MLEKFIKTQSSSIYSRVVNNYFRNGIIVMIDLIVSLIASIGTILLVYLLLRLPSMSTNFIIEWLLLSITATFIGILIVKPYRAIIRYSMLSELSPVCITALIKEALLFLALSFLPDLGISITFILSMVMMDLFISVALLISSRIMMVVVYNMVIRRADIPADRHQVLVYGVGDKSVGMVARLHKSPNYSICGFISDDSEMNDHKVGGFQVYTFTDAESVKELLEESGADGVLFAYPSDVRKERGRLLEYGTEIGCRMFVAPAIDEVKDGKVFDKSIRKIKIEDLLGRPEIKISMHEIEANFKDKVVLVTGAAGSIGSELCRQLATFGIKELVMFDNAETPLHNVRLEFEERFPDLKFTPVIGDVRQSGRLDYVFNRFHPQIVFHAAAYKHVPLMEENPCEAVLVNVVGSRHVADKCLEYGVEKMVMISTDKAVNPTNIMGCTKRLAEIYVQSLGLAIERGEIKGKTKFVTTRFGNVLGSNGSVIPHFQAQIEAGGPITVTHPDIVRYFMSIPEACRLVMEAATISSGNQICVFDMGKPVKISHLAEQMVHLAGLKLGEDIEIKYTGLRPGEKLYEEVLATKENTLPTNHESIFIAKVRSYDYNEVKSVADNLRKLSMDVDIPNMVTLMKATVPEFKSKNSPFEKYDKK